MLLGHRVIEAEEARRLDVGSGPLRESLLLRRRREDAQAAVDFVFRRVLGAGREVDALSCARSPLRVEDDDRKLRSLREVAGVAV